MRLRKLTNAEQVKTRPMQTISYGLVSCTRLVSVSQEHGSCTDGPRDPTEYGKVNISPVSIGRIMPILILMTSHERNISMIIEENEKEMGRYDLAGCTVYSHGN